MAWIQALVSVDSATPATVLNTTANLTAGDTIFKIQYMVDHSDIAGWPNHSAARVSIQDASILAIGCKDSVA